MAQKHNLFKKVLYTPTIQQEALSRNMHTLFSNSNPNTALCCLPGLPDWWSSRGQVVTTGIQYSTLYLPACLVGWDGQALSRDDILPCG